MENEDFLEELDLESSTDSVASFTVPSFKKTSVNKFYDYHANVYDYETLPELSRAINAARLALFETTERLNECDRRAKKTRTEYERYWRRQYITSKARTEAGKRTDADILSEELEDKFLVYEQLSKELNRHANILRIELQTLQTIGNNTRQQLKMGD